MNDLAKVGAQWISQHVPLAVLIGVFVFCLFFEISKIKVYPLRWLWKLISWPLKKIDEQRTESFKALVVNMQSDLENKMAEMVAGSETNCKTVKECLGQLEERFDNMETRFDELDSRFDGLAAQQSETEERLDKLAAARIKNHVLNFARQCRKGEQHSHEDFRNLFDECKTYDALVEKYGWENNVYVHDYAYIERVYDECNNRGDFLE